MPFTSIVAPLIPLPFPPKVIPQQPSSSGYCYGGDFPAYPTFVSPWFKEFSFSFLTFIAFIQAYLLMFDCLILCLSQIETICSWSVWGVCWDTHFTFIKFLFSVWDTHFTFGGWVVGCFVDWYPCFLFTCQVAFELFYPVWGFEPLSVLCCVIYASWMLA